MFASVPESTSECILPVESRLPIGQRYHSHCSYPLQPIPSKTRTLVFNSGLKVDYNMDLGSQLETFIQ